MKLFDLYIRILKKQIWLYVIYLGIFALFLMLTVDIGNQPASENAVFRYYCYAAFPQMVLVMLTISAVTAVTSDLDLVLRHRAAPIRTELLGLAYLGADMLVMLFWWLLIFWTAVVLYGEMAYSIEGFLMAANLLVLSLFSVAVGFLIGLFTKSAQSRGIFSNLAALVLTVTGGSFGAWYSGDETVYLLRSFTPVFWYQKALEEITQNGQKLQGLRDYAVCIGIQLVFALTVLTFGMMLEKQRKLDIEG